MKPFEERLERIETEEPITIPNADGTTRTVMLKVPALRDPVDGEIYLTAEATTILDKAKARHMGVLAPQELAELRQRLGLTQKQIGELLQIGEKSWSRWETGREIVSRSLNVMLRALYEGKISLPWLRALRDNPAQAFVMLPSNAQKWSWVAAFSVPASHLVQGTFLEPAALPSIPAYLSIPIRAMQARMFFGHSVPRPIHDVAGVDARSRDDGDPGGTACQDAPLAA